MFCWKGREKKANLFAFRNIFISFICEVMGGNEPIILWQRRNEGYREGGIGGEDSHLFLHQKDGKQSLETCRPSKDIVYKTPLFRGKKKTVV